MLTTFDALRLGKMREPERLTVQDVFIFDRYSDDRDAITSFTARYAMSIAASVCELPAASALAIEMRPNCLRLTTHARSSGVASAQSTGSNSVL